MTEKKILELLNTLHEHKMAKDIFVPLLKKMGLKGVRYTGGSDECGIDLEFFEFIGPDKKKSYSGIQFKKGDLKYSARGSKNSIKEIKNQAEEAFDKEIPDIKEPSVHHINRFIVATTGEINQQARTMINKAKINGTNRNIDFWDGEILAEYINVYWIDEFSEYFKIDYSSIDEYEEDAETIVNTEYIFENYTSLIEVCSRVKGTISSYKWRIIYSILKINHFDNNEASLANILYEMKTNDIDYDLRELIDLGYVETNDYTFFLNGRMSEFNELIHNIQTELVEAEEDESIAQDIFDSIIERMN